MILKDKILNKFTDKLKKYKTPDYDYILSCCIKGEVKSAFMTIDCTTVKEIVEKSKNGIVDVSKLLDKEFDSGDNCYKKIIFCDKENVICLYNSKNDTYYEDVYEYFENAEERTYVKCDSNDFYKSFKNFVIQSSKYHELIDFECDIPRKKAFDIIFKSNQEDYYIHNQNNSKQENDEEYSKKEQLESDSIIFQELER